MRVFAHGSPTSVAARPLALRLSGRRLPGGWCALAKCDSYDCVNPDHLTSHNRSEAVRISGTRGEHKTVRKAIACRMNGANRSRISPEIWSWVYESTQSSADIAHALDIAKTHVSQKRAKHRERTLGMTASLDTQIGM